MAASWLGIPRLALAAPLLVLAANVMAPGAPETRGPAPGMAAPELAVLRSSSHTGSSHPGSSHTGSSHTGAGGKPKAVTAKVPAPTSRVVKGRDGLQLLSQNTWVGPDQKQFRLHLNVTASDPSAETLAVIVYAELTARSQFQAAVRGYVSDPYYSYSPAPLTKLVGDPSGVGVDIDIPVNGGGLPLSTTGVYPVQAFLENDGARAGPILTTFLIYAGIDASHLQRLDVSLVVPLGAKVPITPAGVTGAVPAEAAAKIQADSADVAVWHVPLTVRADVPTMESLSTGTPADKVALAHLVSAVGSGDELLPATALPVDLQAMVNSGLTGNLRAELSTGGGVLAKLLGVSPALGTWAAAAGIGTASMAALASMGVARVAVPESNLSPLPPADQSLTFAQPTKLTAGGEIEAVGADSELSSRVSQTLAPTQTVLVANQVLAELAMIDLERPGDVRGIAVLPVPGTIIGPSFLSVLLAGLQGNPLVKATTLRQLFDEVPLASGSPSGPLVRHLEGPESTAPLPGVGQLQGAVEAVSSEGEVFGSTTVPVRNLNEQLVVSLSSVFSASQRAAIITGVRKAATAEIRKVRLPSSGSITLTSRQGRLPLTLVSSAGTPAHVRLVLTSEQLSFVAAKFGGKGSCRPVNPGSENCQLTLVNPTTTLQVPVVVRVPGAFVLSLEVETPNGSQKIAASTDTVRSTAFSDVGLILMVGAAAFLAVWWVRNARHGRRARRLVPRFEEEGSETSRPFEQLPG